MTDKEYLKRLNKLDRTVSRIEEADLRLTKKYAILNHELISLGGRIEELSRWYEQFKKDLDNDDKSKGGE